MSSQPVRILLVGVEADEAQSLLAELCRGGFTPPAASAVSVPELPAVLARDPWDILICADCPPDDPVEAVLNRVRDSGHDIPVVAIVASDDRAAEVIQAGAADGLTPPGFVRLAPVIARELRAVADRRARCVAEAEAGRLSGIISRADYVLICQTLDGTVTTWNAGAERMYGYSANEVLGRNVNFLIPPELQGELQAVREALARGEQVPAFDTVRLHKNGTRLDISVSMSAIRDASGRVVGVSGIGTDISARLRMERQLRETSELLRAVTDAIPDGVFVKDRSGRYLLCNPAAAGFISRPVEDILGQDDSAWFDPAGTRLVASRDLRVMETGQVETEEEVLTSAGTTRVYLATKAPYRNAAGEVVGVIGISRDITDQKRAEESLRVSEERYRTLVAATTAIVWNTPSSGEFAGDQPRWSEFTGQSFDQLRGWGWLDAVHPDDRPATAKAWRAATVSKTTYRVEHRLRRADGTYRHMAVRAVPILNPDGSVREWVGVHSDVTERRQLEDQFRQAQKMEAIGRLAGGVAHDFNNLLTVIAGYADIAQRELPAGHPAQEPFREIAEAADRAAGLTRQLLAFSRQSVLEPRVFDPTALVRDMSRMLSRLIGEDIDLALELSADAGPIRADPRQLEQAVMNLCVNARDAMPHGGRLTVAITSVDLDPSQVGAPADVRPGRYVVLTVQDTGVGMTPDILARVFEPFFTTKEVGKGTGLGLAMVYGFVRQSGGYITLASEAGQGTVVTIYLPQVAAAPARHLKSETNPMPQGEETILVVEDEAALRGLTVRVLRKCGYAVLEAVSGPDALRMMDNHTGPLHLLVTDVVMPGGMGGRQTAEAITARHPGVRVLFVSGYSNDAIILEDRAHFLQKPYSPAALAAKVRAVLDEPTRLG